MSTSGPKTVRERVARKRQRARDAGLCYVCCKQKPEPGRTACAPCRVVKRERKKRGRERDRETKQFGHAVAAHERAGDVAREHHFHLAAVQHYQDALHLQKVGSPGYLRLSEKLAETLFLGNDPTSAKVWYENLLAFYSRNPENAKKSVEALSQVASQLWLASRTENAVAVQAQAIRLAEIHADAKLLKTANLRMASLLSMLARYEEAERYLISVGTIDEEDEEAVRVRYFNERGFLAAALGQEAQAFEYHERAVHIANQSNDAYLSAVVWQNYGVSAMNLGRMELAKACSERALHVARKHNITWFIAARCLDHAQLLMRMGDDVLAHEYLVEALSYDAQSPESDRNIVAVGIPLALRLNDKKILAKCVRTHTIDQAFSSNEPGRIGGVSAAFAKLYVARGQYHKARELLHRAVTAMQAVMDEWDLPLEVAQHGEPADIPQARELLEARCRYPCADLAKAHLCLFDAFVAKRRGMSGNAQARAGEAAMHFRELQWHAYTDLAQQFLPSEQPFLGIANADLPLKTDRSAQLTKREREVAALVLKGLTSRAIAEKLSISPRTVDSHVNEIMSRFGIHSRHQLPYILVKTITT